MLPCVPTLLSGTAHFSSSLFIYPMYIYCAPYSSTVLFKYVNRSEWAVCEIWQGSSISEWQWLVQMLFVINLGGLSSHLLSIIKSTNFYLFYMILKFQIKKEGTRAGRNERKLNYEQRRKRGIQGMNYSTSSLGSQI